MEKIGLKHFAGYMFAMALLTLLASGILLIFNISLSKDNIMFICIIQAFTDLLVFYLYTKYILKESFKSTFGLYFSKSLNYTFLGMSTLLVVCFVTVLVMKFFPEGNHIVSITKLYDTNFYFLMCSAIIIAPLREEFLFRGVLQPMLVNKTNKWLGVILTALVFTGSHIVYISVPIVYIRLFILSLGLGLLKENTKSVLPGYVTHISFNSLSLLR